MGETNIGWTAGPNGEKGYTFGPWDGCAKVSTACKDCYAARDYGVLMRKTQWGPVWQGGTRTMRVDSYWKKPLQWAREAAKAGERRRVFCASLADVLESVEEPARWPRRWTPEEVEEVRAHVAATRAAVEAARERLWQLIRETAYALDWLILTKRPENWRWVPEDVRRLVWLGTSIANQRTAEEYLPRLLEAHGFRLLFVSLEPMVGPVDFTALRVSPVCKECGKQPLASALSLDERCGCTVEGPEGIVWNRLGWVILGGESGAEAKARDYNPEAALSVIEQCQRACVPVYHKQLGRKVVLDSASPLVEEFKVLGARVVRYDGHTRVLLKHPKGEEVAEWPERLRVREQPKPLPLPQVA